jgi:hypothetical protein
MNVIENAGEESFERVLDGNLISWLRLSYLAAEEGSSARAYLVKFVVFLSTESDALQRYTKNVADWTEFSTPILMREKSESPDAKEVADMLAKKKPPAVNNGPVFCCVCAVSLTAYYMIENNVYCSEHRPAQCASCRAALTSDMIQVGFLKFCLALGKILVFFFFFFFFSFLAPPKCVRCAKYISKYITVPDEGIVCVDCGKEEMLTASILLNRFFLGAPKCFVCKNSIVSGHCITFRKEKYHGDCFSCSLW